MKVLIAGGGIAGLALGLSMHQIGQPFQIFESVSQPKPLGVGINLQPACVRELFALGLREVLDQVGIPTQDYGFYTKTGLEIWTEPRGRYAGYHWPQYSVHRGHLQMALLDTLIERCGPNSVQFGSKVVRYERHSNGVVASVQQGEKTTDVTGALLVGADGVHSSVRAQMYPNEGAPVWGGAIMWRGTTIAKPFLTGASMILAGNDSQRFVSYPITAVDPKTNKAVINWIAEKHVDPNSAFDKEDWNRQVPISRFRADFDNWDFGWINVPDLIDQSSQVFEYPMVDREPVDAWTINGATLVGDAAHATYPVGSSGATQAILDVRILAAEIRRLGATENAALAYEQRVRPGANRVTLANRNGGGPDAIMQMAEDRCQADFANLASALPYAEREAHALKFKQLAGLDIDVTNNQPPILEPNS